MRLGGLILAALIFVPASAGAGEVFRCINSEGVLTYAAKKIAGQECTPVAKYSPIRWKYLVTAIDSAVFSIDTETITKSGATTTVWLRESNEDKPKYVSGKGYQVSMIQRMAFNCVKMEYANGAFFSYDANGVAIDSGVPLSETWVPVPPETTTEAAYRFVCSLGKGAK